VRTAEKSPPIESKKSEMKTKTKRKEKEPSEQSLLTLLRDG
jgi:hypothetical protein